MLSLPPSVRLFVATQPVDGRKQADSLMVLVRDVFKHDPLSGHLFVFFTKRLDRVRIVYWDRSGFAMWTKRLEKGRFRPRLSRDGTVGHDHARGRRARANPRRDRPHRCSPTAPLAAEKRGRESRGDVNLATRRSS